MDDPGTVWEKGYLVVGGVVMEGWKGMTTPTRATPPQQPPPPMLPGTPDELPFPSPPTFFPSARRSHYDALRARQGLEPRQQRPQGTILVSRVFGGRAAGGAEMRGPTPTRTERGNVPFPYNSHWEQLNGGRGGAGAEGRPHLGAGARNSSYYSALYLRLLGAGAWGLRYLGGGVVAHSTPLGPAVTTAHGTSYFPPAPNNDFPEFGGGGAHGCLCRAWWGESRREILRVSEDEEPLPPPPGVIAPPPLRSGEGVRVRGAPEEGEEFQLPEPLDLQDVRVEAPVAQALLDWDALCLQLMTLFTEEEEGGVVPGALPATPPTAKLQM